MLLGANLGDVEATLLRAVALIGERVGDVVSMSDVMWSEAWGFEAESRFGNQAIVVESSLGAEELLDAVQQIEAECGRDRHREAQYKAESGMRYCSRELDIDILLFGNEVIATERLRVPHPLLPEREFALMPLSQVCPDWIHPQRGLTISELLNELKNKR